MKVRNKYGTTNIIDREAEKMDEFMQANRKLVIKASEEMDPNGEEAHRIAGKIREEAKNGSRKD